MTENAEANLDERMACELLRNYLRKRAVTKFKCEVSENDPPDLVVTWNTGVRWGVEVTRAYQQVEPIGNNFDKKAKMPSVSSEGVAAALRAFARKLEETTEPIRNRDYSLYLEGPGPFSSWKQPGSLKEWKNKTEEEIRKHIISKSTEKLRFSGGTLKPGNPGKPWLVKIGNSVTEISSSTVAMLQGAVTRKAKSLLTWSGSFDQRWLLILNCNPLVNDVAEIENTLRQLARENQESIGFDGFFYSGYTDRALVEVSPLYLASKNLDVMNY